MMRNELREGMAWAWTREPHRDGGRPQAFSAATGHNRSWNINAATVEGAGFSLMANPCAKLDEGVC